MTDLTSDGKYKRSASNPGALVSVDVGGLEAYRRQKRHRADINKMKDEHDQIKADVAEIKVALATILRIINK